MGWFWADTTSIPVNPHQGIPLNQAPPPSCPMHKPKPAECPSKASEACPYPGSSPAATIPHPTPSPQSPYQSQSQSDSTPSALSRLNPLNYMPFNLSNKPAPRQSAPLPLEREPSTIPRGDGSLWEYPSPQQMYNAMLRKGYTDTPIDAVESMVAVHNFLNEGAWGEILEWERRFGSRSGGVLGAWRECGRGELASRFGANSETPSSDEWKRAAADGRPAPKLLRFMGRPGEMTPKARMLQAAGWAFPAYFAREPPFDRHDWIVQRTQPDGSSREVRYVIDYYSGPPEGDDEVPVFYLDVRPALDTPSAVGSRLMRWGGELWFRGTGGLVREEKERMEKQRGGS